MLLDLTTAELRHVAGLACLFHLSALRSRGSPEYYGATTLLSLIYEQLSARYDKEEGIGLLFESSPPLISLYVHIKTGQ